MKNANKQAQFSFKNPFYYFSSIKFIKLIIKFSFFDLFLRQIASIRQLYLVLHASQYLFDQMQQQRIDNQRPTKASSIYLIMGLAFIFSQTIITLFWLTLSFISQTYMFIFNLCSTIYAIFQNYYLTLITILTILLLQKFRIKMDKFLGNVLQALMDPSFKCQLCNQQGDCDANCKRCKITYHIDCFKKNGIEQKCTNPSCNQQLYNQKCIDIIIFVRNNKKYATYIAIIFALIGLYPSVRDLFRYFSSLLAQ